MVGVWRSECDNQPPLVVDWWVSGQAANGSGGGDVGDGRGGPGSTFSDCDCCALHGGAGSERGVVGGDESRRRRSVVECCSL